MGRWRVRGALCGVDRWIAPATWTVVAGRTASVEPAREADVDAVLVPGLVNAHSHLDLGGGTALADTGDFTAWLLAIGTVREDGGDPALRAERQARALAGRGVVAVGDIDGSRGEGTRGRRRAGLGGRSYLELVGVGRDAARARLADLLVRADRLGGGGVDLGLSPHAPYSVHGAVLPEIARAARRRGLPLAMHLAETPEETRFLTHGDGPFLGFLERIGKGLPFAAVPGLRPIAYAERCGLLGPGTAVIHGNDLDDDDVGLLARAGASVVYCHGTHRHFDRPPHRLLDLERAGVSVALGTDSALSNAGLDLLGELCRLAADRPDVPPGWIVHAATVGGLRALGLDPLAGTLAPGGVADATLLGPPPSDIERASAADVCAWIVSGAALVVDTVRDGVSAAGATGAPPALLDSPPGRG